MKISRFKCDRCKINDALRITVNLVNEAHKTEKVSIDLCSECVYYGFGLLIKKISKKEREEWLSQFAHGIIS